MMRALKSIPALVAVAVIVGQVGTEQRAAVEPRNRGLRRSSNSEPVQVLVRACGNCHSNHTDWPWYSHVAPVSWWIARHVREGREKLDFSEWETYSTMQKRDKLESMCGLISTGRMPPRMYTAMHPEAKLTDENKKAVCAWVKEQTIAAR
jgi:Haem-binding domain